MKSVLFVVILNYIVPLEKIDAHREQHLQFLDHYYAEGVFIASGAQVPRVGGVILAKASSKEDLEKILSNDPFFVNKLAEYKIYEFVATKHSESFFKVLAEK